MEYLSVLTNKINTRFQYHADFSTEIEYDLKYNKTMQEIRRKAGCKDIHAWDIKNI